MTDDCLLGYAAGLIDGEGCISVGQSGMNFYARLQIGMRCPDAVQFMYRNFGGNEPKQDARGIWTWYLVSSEKLAEFLGWVSPYMIVKKKQAQLAIALCGLSRPNGVGGQSAKLTDREMLMRVSLAEAIKRCNSEYNERSKRHAEKLESELKDK